MSEEQAQQLMYQMQMLEGYLTDLSQKESSLLNIVREAISATESIKNSKIKSDSKQFEKISNEELAKHAKPADASPK